MEQSALIEGRKIHDNIYIVHEIVHSIYNSKSANPVIFIKLDLEEAFETIKRKAITLVLSILKFPRDLIAWVKAYIDSPAFICNVNGKSSRPFKASRGIRQGDPLSPYLYVITANIFSILLNDDIRKKNIDPFKVKGKYSL